MSCVCLYIAVFVHVFGLDALPALKGKVKCPVLNAVTMSKLAFAAVELCRMHDSSMVPVSWLRSIYTCIH